MGDSDDDFVGMGDGDGSDDGKKEGGINEEDDSFEGSEGSVASKLRGKKNGNKPGASVKKKAKGKRPKGAAPKANGRPTTARAGRRISGPFRWTSTNGQGRRP